MNRRWFLLAIPAAAGVWYASRRQSYPVLSPTIDLEPLAGLNDQRFDVCVVGSGPAGCTAAKTLADAGKKVLLLESGSSMQSKNRSHISEKLDCYRSTGELDYPVGASRIRALGGTSNIWTGRVPRMLPADFENNPLAPNGSWPISYADLSAHYDEAEITLNVYGDTLSAHSAPRAKDFPTVRPADIDELRTLLASEGIAADSPPGSSSVTLDGNPTRFGVDYVPVLMQHPNVVVASEATVTRLHAGPSGDIQAATVRRLDDESVDIAAGSFVLACGAIETANLLLKSNRAGTTPGIGDQSGYLAKGFMEHPWRSLEMPLTGKKHFSKWQLARTHDFHGQFRDVGLGSVLVSFYGLPSRHGTLRLSYCCEMVPDERNKIEPIDDSRDGFGDSGVALRLSFGDRDLELQQRARRFCLQILRRFGSENYVESESVTWSHHHMGMTRMASHPDNGVVDSNLRVFGTENLYIASSSVFVTSGIANPTLTIVALSHRLGQQLASFG